MTTNHKITEEEIGAYVVAVLVIIAALVGISMAAGTHDGPVLFFGLGVVVFSVLFLFGLINFLHKH